MKLLSGEKLAMAQTFMEAAVAVAHNALCARAKCGSVIVKDGVIVSSGYNAPPLDDQSQARCLRKEELKPGFKSDRTCCIHAEQRAILSTSKTQLKGADIYFIRLDQDGKPEFAGKPYCTHCSKIALDAGIQHFLLWHKEGITEYGTVEYNDLSYEYNGE